MIYNHSQIWTPETIEDIHQKAQGMYQLTAFNPFSETPVEGVHWKKGPSFGQPTSPSSYQSPRDFNFSVGFRF